MTTIYLFTDDCNAKNLHVEIGLLVDSASLKTLQRELQSLASEVYPDMPRDNWVNIHAVYIWNQTKDRKLGGWDWSKTSRFQAEEFFVRAIPLVNKYASQIWQQNVRLGQHGKTFTKDEVRGWALLFLIQKLDKLIGTTGALGVVFADKHSNEKIEKRLSAKLHKMVTSEWAKGKSGPIKNSLLPINFVNSAHSVGVQAADLIAYVVQRCVNNIAGDGPDVLFMRERLAELTKMNSTSRWP